jgi:hypothetical protein
MGNRFPKRRGARSGWPAAIGVLVAGTLVLGAVVASGSAGAPTPDLREPSPSRTRAPSDTSGLAAARLKPIGEGLYLTSGPSADLPFIDHVVVGVAWAALEPRDQVFPRPAWRRLSSQIHRPPGLRVRVRIMAGRFAPTFVKRMGGPPVSSKQVDCSRQGGIAILQPFNDIASCVPYFWTGGVLRQYKQLMVEVSRRFDHDPHVLDVVDSACMTNWAEPFIRSGSDRDSNARLWEAGLDEATDRHCLERSLRIHDRVFRRTRVSLATHQQWQIVVDPATDADGVAPSWDKERALLERFIEAYGRKLVLQNNGLGGDEGCPASAPPNSSLFCWMATQLDVKGFQLEGDRRLEADGLTVHDGVARALELGACFVEHNQFGSDPVVAERYEDLLQQNC